MNIYFNTDKFIDWIFKVMIDIEDDKPYTDEKLSDNTWIRTFNPSISNSDEYVWHRDEKDRVITVLEGNGWKFQFDNDIPKVINSSDKLVIPKGVYHRLIVGNTCLKLKIEEA
jgi:cupin superfamily acireductone dioxygenase involved in methionine salvage